MNSELQPGGGALGAAVEWLQALLLGSVATTIAVLAVASVGFLLLSGRIDLRRGAQVVFGCFILFGASTIATGIMRRIEGTQSTASAEALPAASPPLSVATTAQAAHPDLPYDPYAGAALPVR